MVYGENRALSEKEGGNYGMVVYKTMFYQICRDYPSLPDPRTLKIHEIIFFYDGLREEIVRHYNS